MRPGKISFYPTVFRTMGSGKCGCSEERGFYTEKGIGTLNKSFKNSHVGWMKPVLSLPNGRLRTHQIITINGNDGSAPLDPSYIT
ncbi:MAG: hypothetical protein A2W17_12240 [Planctomycetes bacterium RBG_16_41_13]|nr:MAG: hypothetical protein A2W17_12240 [Planctomycetes bacterium RBG_16_41_13]